jgi:cholest-4-en-3-one 26-monooxygenase
MLIDRAWVVSRHEDISAVDRDPETFAADQGHVNIWKVTPIDPKNGGMPAMLTFDGADHRRNRQVISKGFTPKVVRQLAEKFRGYAVGIVDTAIAKGTFNFVTEGDACLIPRASRGHPVGGARAACRWVELWAEV